VVEAHIRVLFLLRLEGEGTLLLSKDCVKHGEAGSQEPFR
jgi:hypothetical protein